MTKWDDESLGGASWAPVSDNELTVRLSEMADRERRIEHVATLSVSVLVLGLIVIFLIWLAKVVLF